MTDKYPLLWRILHWMIVWAPVEPVDEINEWSLIGDGDGFGHMQTDGEQARWRE